MFLQKPKESATKEVDPKLPGKQTGFDLEVVFSSFSLANVAADTDPVGAFSAKLLRIQQLQTENIQMRVQLVACLEVILGISISNLSPLEPTWHLWKFLGAAARCMLAGKTMDHD